MRFKESEPNLYDLKEKRSPREIIESRLNQSRSSRLIEYATGLKPDDPRMGDKLVEDTKRIEVKYNLPPIAGPLAEIEHRLREIARENKVDIREKSACGSFFKENPYEGVYLSELNVAGVDIDKNEKEKYWKSLLALRHELIHALQHIQYPSMPIEVMEYEAYMGSGLSADRLKQNPDKIETVLGFFLSSSVSFWYNEENKKRKQGESKIKPAWDNPEFFLRQIDNVSDQDVERYKKTDDYNDYEAIRKAEEEISELYSQEDYDIEKVNTLHQEIDRLNKKREDRKLNNEEES
jgi:hypothetical protein